MNENLSFERNVAEHIANEGVAPPSDAFYNELITSADRHGQRPRWLALIKEPPMRIESRIAVGSPTARVAAIMVATLLLAISLAAAGLAGSRLLAADGAIVVDQSGGGDYTTITEAVAAAADGDEIVVMPGVYAEYVDIDKDITLRGDGAPKDVVIAFSDEGQTAPSEQFGDFPFGIALRDSDAVVQDLTVVPEGSPVGRDVPGGQGVAINVQGGAPTIERVVVSYGEDALIVLESGTQALLSGIHDHGGVAVLDASPTIVDSVFCNGVSLELSNATFRDNQVIQATPDGEVCPLQSDGPSGEEVAIGGGSPALTGNTIVGLTTGINVRAVDESGASPLIEGNVVRDTQTAVAVGGDTTPIIRANEFAGNRTAITLPGGSGDSGTSVEDNTIIGGSNAILVTGGSYSIVGNDISGATGRAVAIGPNGAPTLRDNVLCGNDQNLFIADGATPDIDESNEVCEDGLAE